MSRCMTLEEYLERFVDENTQSADGEITLIIPDAQAQTLGLFFINGLAGYIACVRNEQDTRQMIPTSENEQDEGITDDRPMDQDDLIN
jgi:hypothetical protein